MATVTTTAHICRNFINGKWVESRGGTVERRNPANTDEVVAVVPLSTREEAREAIAAAKAAFPGLAGHHCSGARTHSGQGQIADGATKAGAGAHF